MRASTYAARAKLSFAGNVSWRFNECSKHLGTQPRIHRTRRNLSSPVPVFSINALNLTPPALRVNPIVVQRLSDAGRLRWRFGGLVPSVEYRSFGPAGSGAC